MTAVAKPAFYHLRNISRIRKYTSFHTGEILMHAFVTFRLEFCNSILYGIRLRMFSKDFSQFRMQQQGLSP